MYAIMVDYYVWDATTEMESTDPMYLGVAFPPKNLYVFDEKHNSRSFRWDTREEAEEYIETHPHLKGMSNFENLRIVEV